MYNTRYLKSNVDLDRNDATLVDTTILSKYNIVNKNC